MKLRVSLSSLAIEEQMLFDKVGKDWQYLYEQVTSDTSNTLGLRMYLHNCFLTANKKFFANKLPKTIYFRIMRNVGPVFNHRGKWQEGIGPSVGTGIISISRRLFNAPSPMVLSTLLHELCHAAVSLIDKEPKGGHGPKWERWMKHCGLTPSRYSKYDDSEFLTDTERTTHNGYAK